ncbi:hypothetical protein D3C79_562070 [compost metagenome]
MFTAGRGACAAFAIDAQACGFRRVAQAFVGAALVTHQQGEGTRVVARQLDIEHAVVYLDIAEELIVLGLALGDAWCAQGNVGRFGAELEAVAIEVVAVGSDEAQLDGLRIGLDQAELEGLVYRQEVGVVGQRSCAEGGAGAVVEQARGEGRAGQQQEQQEKQAAHGGLARWNVLGMIAELVQVGAMLVAGATHGRWLMCCLCRPLRG